MVACRIGSGFCTLYMSSTGDDDHRICSIKSRVSPGLLYCYCNYLSLPAVRTTGFAPLHAHVDDRIFLVDSPVHSCLAEPLLLLYSPLFRSCVTALPFPTMRVECASAMVILGRVKIILL